MAEWGEQGVNGENKGMRGGKGLFIGSCCINYFSFPFSHEHIWMHTHSLPHWHRDTFFPSQVQMCMRVHMTGDLLAPHYSLTSGETRESKNRGENERNYVKFFRMSACCIAERATGKKADRERGKEGVCVT